MWQPEWEGSLGENGYMYMYGWVHSLFTWNYHNIINCLYSNIKYKDKEKKKIVPKGWWSIYGSEKEVAYIKGSVLHRADFHASILTIWDLIYKNSNLCETLGEVVSFCFSSLKEMGICRKLWKCIGSDDSLTRRVRCRIMWSLLKISAREL